MATKEARYRFVDRLVVAPDDDGRNWTLEAGFSWRGPDDEIRIPAGFVTDFASIPRALWWLYPPTGRWGRAAVIHDWLYRKQTRSRAEADAIFLEGMRARAPSAPS